MRISAKTEYACIAMLELASQYGSAEPVRIREIAERHGVPPRFLVQILLQLKGAGLVTSVRGAAGGYRLLNPPDEVSLGRIMEVIDGLLDEEAPEERRLARLARRESPDAGLERGLRHAVQDARRHLAGRSAGTREGAGRADVSYLTRIFRRRVPLLGTSSAGAAGYAPHCFCEAVAH